MKNLSLVLVLTVISASSFACDVCGSATGSIYIGILPDFRKKFIGLRYQHSSLVSHLAHDGSNTALTATERFHTTELWGAWNIGSKFRIAGFIPYNVITRQEHNGSIDSKRGIGDVAVIAYYNLLQKRNSAQSRSQSLWMGAGIKLQSGAYDPGDKNVLSNSQNTFQLGTGSFDFNIHAMYDLRLGRAGLNTNFNYKMNTANAHDYHYGNKLTTNVLGYYRFTPGSQLSFTPNAGIYYELATQDRSGDVRLNATGGHAMLASFGVESGIGRLGFGANVQTPLSKHVHEGKSLSQDKGMVYVSFSF